MRENILFGLPYDEQRYLQAVQAACLDTDLQMLPGGDQTELGECPAGRPGHTMVTRLKQSPERGGLVRASVLP